MFLNERTDTNLAFKWFNSVIVIQILLTNVVLKQIRRYKIIHDKYQQRRQTFAVRKVGALAAFPLRLQIHILSEKTGM